uniref:Uncharacterized protein n=1 Tax=Anguilla anguilla TaxID=7936 RepID=A0A0E9SRZ0_ANGAN
MHLNYFDHDRFTQFFCPNSSFNWQ